MIMTYPPTVIPSPYQVSNSMKNETMFLSIENVVIWFHTQNIYVGGTWGDSYLCVVCERVIDK